jgi:hypothetical protein
MITEAKNKGKPRKKKTEISKPADIIASGREPKKCSCARCHATVDFKQTSKCRNCGVYGCTECGYDPNEKVCSKCGAKR